MKYFIKKDGDEIEITSKDYETEMIIDAGYYDQPKYIAMRTVRENRQDAREFGLSRFTLFAGTEVLIRK